MLAFSVLARDALDHTGIVSSVAGIDRLGDSATLGLAKLPGFSPSRLKRVAGLPTETGHSADYSHSMVPGGLLVTSSTTRFTPSTSFVMRFEILANSS